MAAECYKINCAIGFGVFIVFRRDTLTAWCCVRYIELCIREGELALEDEGWQLKIAEVKTSP
jgi:hypothetical protein